MTTMPDQADRQRSARLVSSAGRARSASSGDGSAPPASPPGQHVAHERSARRRLGGRPRSPPRSERQAPRRRRDGRSTCTVTSGSPVATGSPTFLWSTRPTAGSMPLSTVSRPAPSSIAGVADARGRRCAPRGRRAPSASSTVSRARGSSDGSSQTRGSPPCSSITSWKLAQPGARARARRAPCRARRRASARRRRGAASRPRARARATRGPWGRGPSASRSHSATSSALPTVRPERLVHVGDERRHLLAHAAADRDHRLGQRPRVLVALCMNAPSPVLTSSTSASMPSAIFLLMIEAAMSGRLSTVAVTSRSA